MTDFRAPGMAAFPPMFAPRLGGYNDGMSASSDHTPDEYIDIDLRRQAPKDAVDRAIDDLDQLMRQRQWKQAAVEAVNLQQRFAGTGDAPRVAGLPLRVKSALERYKLGIRKKFLEAFQQNQVDSAVQLLSELDAVLTSEEAKPLAPVVRQLLEAKKGLLATQFKMAIHMQDWGKAVETGEEIQRYFPNSRMATEAGTLLVELRKRNEQEHEAESPT